MSSVFGKPLVLLLFSFVLLPVSATSQLRRPPAYYQDDFASANQALKIIISELLVGQNLLLITDEHSQSLLDVDQILTTAGSSHTPATFTTQNGFLGARFPVHQIQGSFLTTILLFYKDPTNFLRLLEYNQEWNPSYLLLFCLNVHINATTIIQQPVVQRSQFISLLQLTVLSGRQRISTYTTLPTSIMAPLGIWNPKKFGNLHTLFPQRFQNFGGQKLEIPVSCYDQPFLYLSQAGECIGGNLDALQVIGDKHNFTYTLILLDTLNWGVKENGVWQGMLGELMYGKRDIVISSMRLNPDRFSDFDHVYPYWKYSFAMILLVPPATPRWKNILYPFSALMWVLVLIATVTVASVLAFLLNRLQKVKDPVDIVLKVMSGLLGQSMDDSRVRMYPWARVWLIFWWISVDILAAAYMSNLMSVLTLPVYPRRIQTLKGLDESEMIPSMTDYGGFVPQALKASDNPIYTSMGRKMYLDPIVLPNPYDNLMSGVLNGTHGLMDSIDYVIYLQHRYGVTQSTYIMEEKLYKDHMTWLLNRHTPYTPLFSSRLQRIVETGILGQIYRMHMATLATPTIKIPGSGVLRLDHLQGAFIALFLGCGVALLILGLENLLHRRLCGFSGSINKALTSVLLTEPTKSVPAVTPMESQGTSTHEEVLTITSRSVEVTGEAIEVPLPGRLQVEDL